MIASFINDFFSEIMHALRYVLCAGLFACLLYGDPPQTPSPKKFAISDVGLAEVKPLPYLIPHARRFPNVFDRLRNGFALPNHDDARIKQWERILLRNSELYCYMEGGGKYLHWVIKQTEMRGLPSELALIPAVESQWHRFAESHANALGLWQFIYGTGQTYKLQVYTRKQRTADPRLALKDERYDPIKSTHAALDYLQHLQQKHKGDWFMAIAEYNAGDKGAIKRGRKFFAIPQNSLRREQRFYLPKLLALRNIINNPARYKAERLLPRLVDEHAIWGELPVHVGSGCGNQRARRVQ